MNEYGFLIVCPGGNHKVMTAKGARTPLAPTAKEGSK